VVVDTRTGAAIGSTMTVGAATFDVVGQVTDRTLLGGGPMVCMSIGDARSVALGGRALVTAVVTRGTPSTTPLGFLLLTNQEVEQRTLDAMAPAVSSINNTKVLMWIVAGIIIAALLYVSALQRVRDFAVLKALGSSSVALLGSLALPLVAVVVGLLASLVALRRATGADPAAAFGG
jgi:putative ABC transport system permease protein